MKASNSSGVTKYSLGWHKFLIYFFIPVVVGVMSVVALCSLFMFFACGLYETLSISGLFANWIAGLEGGFFSFLVPVIQFIETLLTSIFNLTGGLAPAMHIRHLTICYLSVGVVVLALMARNSLAYFERNAVALINSLMLAIGGYFIAAGWLFQYVLTFFVNLKPQKLTGASFFGFRIFAYISTYYKLFTSTFFKESLTADNFGRLFDGVLIPSQHFPDGRDMFSDIALVQKYLSNSEVSIAIITVLSLLAISGLLVLICTLYYKKRKSLFEFSI